MKRMLTYALGAVLATVAAPAFSQENFPDTQENHWAYEALLRMKAAGLLVGYPDGMFRGGRPASRYEMAVALYALYTHLKGISDGLEAQINALKAQVDAMKGVEGVATKEDLKAVSDALAAAQASINGMKAWGDDIAALKRMSSTFEKELASMGVDVEALKKGVQDLANRVEALEKRKMPVNISGDVNLFLLGGYSDDDLHGIDFGGRPLGVPRDGSDPVGITKDLSIGFETAMRLTGNNGNGTNWQGTFVVGNLSGDEESLDGLPGGTMFGNQSHVFNGVPYLEAATGFYVQDMFVDTNTSLWGLDFNAKMGRVGHKVGPYFFQRPDNTPYYSNDRWDNGMWYFDGAVFTFDFGSTDLTVFGGRQSGRFDSLGNDMWFMAAGQGGHYFSPGSIFSERPRGYGDMRTQISVDQHLGATLNVPISDRGGINLAYLILDSNSTTAVGSSLVNRVIVFGGDVSFMLNDRLKLYGGYSQTNMNLDNDNLIDEDNAAWWAGIAYKADRWGLKVGYRSIDPQFYAPGYWGRMGIWWNPTDIEGFMVGFNADLTDRLSLHLHGAQYQGREITLGGILGLTNDDTITHFKGELNYKLNDDWDLMIGAEMVNWDLEDRILPAADVGGFTGGKPKERWYSLGLKKKMGSNGWWSFLWQISDYDSEDVSGFTPFGGADTKAKGGLISTQIGIKY